jgi:hypothetical protein
LATFFGDKDKINFIGIHEGEGGKAAIFIESEHDVSTFIDKFHLGLVEGSIMKVRMEPRDTSMDELVNDAEEERCHSDESDNGEGIDMKIEVGDVVEVHGLVANSSLNGSAGVVISPQGSTGRYAVNIGLKKISVKEINVPLLDKGV